MDGLEESRNHTGFLPHHDKTIERKMNELLEKVLVFLANKPDADELADEIIGQLNKKCDFCKKNGQDKRAIRPVQDHLTGKIYFSCQKHVCDIADGAIATDEPLSAVGDLRSCPHCNCAF